MFDCALWNVEFVFERRGLVVEGYCGAKQSMLWLAGEDVRPGIERKVC